MIMGEKGSFQVCQWKCLTSLPALAQLPQKGDRTLVGWLVGWLVGRLVGWLVGCWLVVLRHPFFWGGTL